MTKVFLDTVGLLALWDEDDQWHGAADRAMNALPRGQTTLVTSTYILLECGKAAARRPYRSAVDQLRRDLSRAGTLVAPSADEWEQAWAAYARGGADQAGIVDQVSFILMLRLGMTDAFTNDRHFAAAGFRTLF